MTEPTRPRQTLRVFASGEQPGVNEIAEFLHRIHRHQAGMGRFGFPQAGGTAEDEWTDEALPTIEDAVGADDSVGDGLHGFVLADDDDALVENPP